MPVSKTKMSDLVRGWQASAVDDALTSTPALFDVRDERGRNWLHLCCGVPVKGKARGGQRSVETAAVLLEHGFDVNEEAFTEDDWRATPVWFAVGRGENLVLAEYLLQQGCSPDYALYAASFRDNFDAIRLLLRYGADVDDRSAGETPFLGAVKVSRFRSAELLLEFGADVDARDTNGMTALHYMLKKVSDKKHVRMLVKHGARGDIPDAKGATAAEIMARKKDPDFRRMAAELATG